MIAVALALTIVVEGIIASAIWRAGGSPAGPPAAGRRGRAARGPAGQRPARHVPWLETIAIQLTTWPLAQWLLWRTGKFWPIELGVMIVEMLLWRIVLPISLRRAAAVSIVANAVTAGIALALS